MITGKIKEKAKRTAKAMRLLSIISVAALALILGVATPQVRADGPLEFDEGQLYFELNNTDGDLGIHGLLDGGPWKSVWIKGPDKRTLLNVIARGRLRRQVVTELFFESAEPTFDELSPKQFFRRFPAGTYKIFGWSEDGELLMNETEVSHVMPAPPGYTSNGAVAANAENELVLRIRINDTVDLVDKANCEEGGEPTPVELDPDGNIVIAWPPVEDSHPTIGDHGDIKVELYQGVVEFETEDEFEAKYTVDLPPGVTSFTVPGSFIALGLDEDGEGEFKYEILVKEAEGGNQTATESCFEVLD